MRCDRSLVFLSDELSGEKDDDDLTEAGDNGGKIESCHDTSIAAGEAAIKESTPK